MRMLLLGIAVILALDLVAAGPVEMRRSALLSPDGKEMGVTLRFGDEALEILKNNEAVKKFPYAEISDVNYSFSTSPRWKTGTAMMATVVLAPVGGVLLAMKGRKHWLTIAAKNESAALHLDKKNYLAVIAELEGKTGKRVGRDNTGRD